MRDERAFVRAAALGLLTAVAMDHPLGHQTNKAARFILTSRTGTAVEIMFEKNEESPPNLWCLEKAAGRVLISSLSSRFSPASKLRTECGKNGKLLYGRHSGLEKMPQLGDADLVCFVPQTVTEIGQIIDRLRCVTAAEIA